MLKTQRLILRPWQEEDAEILFDYAKDPLVGPMAGWPPHTSVEESREIIRNVLCVPETYAVCLADGRPVGSIGLKLNGHTDMTDRDDECELGYWLGRPFWGQGLIPEAARALLGHAFEDLGMRSVWCGYYDGNGKSRRVQEKLGFIHKYTTDDLYLPLMNETRRGHTQLTTRARWEELYGHSDAAKKVKITALRKVCHEDLMAKYENPMEHACCVEEGMSWVSLGGEKPENFCDSAWQSMEYFVRELARGGGNFYDGWMKDPHSAMISCNDGFRPVSFYLETLEE